MAVTEKRTAPVEMPKRVTITVGVHSAEGDELHNDATFAEDGALEPGAALTVAEVGTFHEFGTRTIPARSFIRGWFDENREFIADTLRKQFASVAAGKRTAEVAGERCALAFEGAVKQRISRGIPPPLAASTVAAKGSSRPLIDTGQLRNAVRSRTVVE